MKKVKYITILLISAILSAVFAGCAMGEDGKDGRDGKDGKDGKDAPSIAEQTFDVKIEEPTLNDVVLRGRKDGEVSDLGHITLGFLTGKEEIPYVPLFDNILKALKGNAYSISEVNAETTEVTITNSQTKTKAVVDLKGHAIYFDNYDAFFQNSQTYLDPTACANIGDYMEITDASNIPGQPIKLDWVKQDIGVVIFKVEEDYCLGIPLQTFDDVFGGTLIYNGKNLYYSTDVKDIPVVAADYYGTETASGVRSEALAEFCYNELCLNLDLNYGLKAIHGIEAFPDFDSYFKAAGIRDDLKSTNALTFANALNDVCSFYFGDGHSSYNVHSYYLGKDATLTEKHTSAMFKSYLSHLEDYVNARNEKIGSQSVYSDGNKVWDPVKCYEVSSDGKTAIVRFDHFTVNQLKGDAIKTLVAGFTDEKMDAYVHALENEYDTIALIHAINEKIQADSNIENIVLDMSLNGGGANHSAAFVLAWLLGECTFDFNNPITGAKWSATYKADVNLDGYYNSADTVSDKNLFCLISPISFSCGNMVPAMLKASGRATILGVMSGGGTSCVYNTSAADGTIFQVSSKNVMSVVKNGSSYDIDTGIEPHYYINKPENFYDKVKISALVNDINEAKLAN